MRKIFPFSLSHKTCRNDRTFNHFENVKPAAVKSLLKISNPYREKRVLLLFFSDAAVRRYDTVRIGLVTLSQIVRGIESVWHSTFHRV